MNKIDFLYLFHPLNLLGVETISKAIRLGKLNDELMEFIKKGTNRSSFYNKYLISPYFILKERNEYIQFFENKVEDYYNVETIHELQLLEVECITKARLMKVDVLSKKLFFDYYLNDFKSREYSQSVKEMYLNNIWEHVQGFNELILIPSSERKESLKCDEVGTSLIPIWNCIKQNENHKFSIFCYKKYYDRIEMKEKKYLEVVGEKYFNSIKEDINKAKKEIYRIISAGEHISPNRLRINDYISLNPIDKKEVNNGVVKEEKGERILVKTFKGGH